MNSMTKYISDSNGNSFLIGEYVGKGSFSQVYKLECCASRMTFAGKFVSKEKLHKFGIGHKVWDEIQIHKRLSHRNIVQFYTHIERESHIIIVLEYCSKYSLINIVHFLKTLSINEAKFFMLQIVSAVEYLHKNLVVHRDLKLGNLFVNRSLEIKLGDFGLAVVIEHKGQKRFSRCGTPNYISPEVIKGIGHSYEVDVWAIGCILYTMLEGIPPFEGKDTTSTYNNILTNECKFSLKAPPCARTFIIYCLKKEAKDRPRVCELWNFDLLATRNIQPRAPKIDFGQDKIKSDYKHRKVTDLWEPEKTKCAEFVYNNFEKLLNCLSNVQGCSVSKRGELLSESNIKIPLVWVNTWMDFTNRYGFAYQLNNNNFGIIYNDGTRMIFEEHDRLVHYVQKSGAVLVFKENAVPDSMRKMFSILIKCRNYMKGSLRDANSSKNFISDSRQANVTVEVFYWTRGCDETAMFLTNGSLQLNFASDHTKVVICGVTKTVTVIERAGYMKTLKLGVIEKCGCSSELKGKLILAAKYISDFLSEIS